MTDAVDPDRSAVFFADAEEFRAWLEEHHESATELWMGIYRKGDPEQGLTWDEAVPVALCYGWIDSVSQRIDDRRRRQRWTPRKPRSIWSDVNVAHVERLIAEGLMRPAGLAAYERRTPERSGVYSHERADALSADELAALAADPAAQAFWDAATPSYRKAVVNWVHGAKQEKTRAQRLATVVSDCAAGRLVPFQRYGDPPAWLTRAAQAAEAARG